MKKNYREWLAEKFPNAGVASVRISNAKRVEKYYGDLDDHYAKDRLNGVLRELVYSSDDQRRGAPNPTLIPVANDANIFNCLNTLRSATKLYVQFCDDGLQTKRATNTANVDPSKIRECELTELRETLRLDAAIAAQNGQSALDQINDKLDQILSIMISKL
jgi:hypothetical protein